MTAKQNADVVRELREIRKSLDKYMESNDAKVNTLHDYMVGQIAKDSAIRDAKGNISYAGVAKQILAVIVAGLAVVLGFIQLLQALK